MELTIHHGAQPPTPDAVAAWTPTQCVAVAVSAKGMANWIIGAAASRYVDGLSGSYAEFARLTGLGDGRAAADRASQLARVWLDFGTEWSRWPGLSWTHFLIAQQQGNEDLLDLAVDNQWSVTDLRRHVAAIGGGAADEPIDVEFAEADSTKPVSCESPVSHDHIHPDELERPSVGKARDRELREDGGPDTTELERVLTGLTGPINRALTKAPALRYAIADQLVAISDQLKADEDATGLDRTTLRAIVREVQS